MAYVEKKRDILQVTNQQLTLQVNNLQSKYDETQENFNDDMAYVEEEHNTLKEKNRQLSLQLQRSKPPPLASPILDTPSQLQRDAILDDDCKIQKNVRELSGDIQNEMTITLDGEVAINNTKKFKGNDDCNRMEVTPQISIANNDKQGLNTTRIVSSI